MHRSGGIHFHFVALEGQAEATFAGFPLRVSPSRADGPVDPEQRGYDPPLVRSSFIWLTEADLSSLSLPDARWLRQDRAARAQLAKLLLVPRLFQAHQPDVDQLIVLDCCDILFQDDVRHLWNQVDRFGPDAVVGAVVEQIDTYQQDVSPWATPLPFPDGDDGVVAHWGFNTGVLLVRVAACIESRFMERALDAVQRAGAAGQFLTAAPLQYDQDAVSLFAAQEPSLVHVLPCSWNVQLTTHSNRRHRPCNLRPAVLHANADTKWRLGSWRTNLLSQPRGTLFWFPAQQPEDVVLLASSVDQFLGAPAAANSSWQYGFANIVPAGATAEAWPPPRDAFRPFDQFRWPFSLAGRPPTDDQLREAVEALAKIGSDHFDAHQYLLLSSTTDDQQQQQCTKARAACRYTVSDDGGEQGDDRLLFAQMQLSEHVTVRDLVSIGRYGHYASDRVAVIRRWQPRARPAATGTLRLFGRFNLGATYNSEDVPARPPVCNDRWQMDLVHRRATSGESVVLVRRTLARSEVQNYVFDGLHPLYTDVPDFEEGDAIDLCVRIVSRDFACEDGGGIRWPMSVIIEVYQTR